MVYDSPSARIRAGINDYFTATGSRPPTKLVKVIAVFDDGTRAAIPFFKPPTINDSETEIYEALERAGKPLQYKELAEASGLSLRSVERHASAMYAREVVMRHPKLGFYLPGAKIEE